MHLVIFWAAIIITVLLVGKFMPYDSTDDAANKKRSGLAVHTDHATGVQYISTGIFGGACVRIYADGTLYKGK